MKEVHARPATALARCARAYAKTRYAILFYSLLATIFATPLLEAFGLNTGLLEVFLAANLVAAVMPITRRAGRSFLLSLLLTVLSVRVAALWFDHALFSNASLALWTIVALLAAARMLYFALRAQTVDRERLYAALDAYLLFGIFVGALYWTLERTWPGSLLVAGQPEGDPLSLAASIYFSFVTLVTLGYGDILPRSDVARGLAIVEAVTGQLYLAVMIAHLVGLYVRTPPGDSEEPRTK